MVAVGLLAVGLRPVTIRHSQLPGSPDCCSRGLWLPATDEGFGTIGVVYDSNGCTTRCAHASTTQQLSWDASAQAGGDGVRC